MVSFLSALERLREMRDNPGIVALDLFGRSIEYRYTYDLTSWAGLSCQNDRRVGCICAT